MLLTKLINNVSQHNTRSNSINNKHESIMKVDAFAKLDHNIMSNINKLRDEITNMKDSVIKRLLEKNEKLLKKCSKLKSRLVTTESSLNQLEQCWRRNNTVVTGIADDVSDDQLEESVIKILADVDVNVEASDI